MGPKIVRVTTVSESLKTLLKGQHKFISESGFEVIGVSSPGVALDDVSSIENIRVIALNMSRKITPVKDLLSVYSLYKILRKEKPLIVHSHTPKAGIVTMLAAKFARIPIRLHTVAGLPLMEETGIKRRLLEFIEKLTYSCATKVYSNSKGLYDFILEQNFTLREKLDIIADGSSNGIDTAYFSVNAFTQEQVVTLKRDLSINERDFVFIFVGRLVGDKGINELISAFTRISTPNLKLLLVGSFETELDPLQTETLKAIEIHPDIIFVGFQEDVRPYLVVSDCLVFPSYREGFPNVVMQAGAMGLPSIVTDINGCNEIISNGINGTIIPVKNVEAIVESMQKMCTNKAYYKKLQKNARPMIEARFKQQVVWEALLAEYKSLHASHNK